MQRNLYLCFVMIIACMLTVSSSHSWGTSSLSSHTAKILWFGRLQHGQGQDEEQAASSGRTWQEPGNWWPHPHATRSTPEEVILGDQQASWLAFIIQEAPSPPWDSQQTSLLHLTCIPSMSTPFPLFLLHPQAPLALTYRAELNKLKLPFACMWVGQDGRDGDLGGPQVRSLLCLPTTHSSAPSVHSALPPPLYLGFQCSKMHYSRCVCYRAGVWWDELMHFVFCIVFFFFFASWMTPK